MFVFVAFGSTETVLAWSLSGFFALGTWWIRGLLAICILPWAISSVSASLFIDWTLT